LVPAAPKGFVSELPKANARLRLAKSGEYLLETTMIPIVAGDVLTRRVATEFVLKDHESLTLSFFDWPAKPAEAPATSPPEPAAVSAAPAASTAPAVDEAEL